MGPSLWNFTPGLQPVATDLTPKSNRITDQQTCPNTRARDTSHKRLHPGEVFWIQYAIIHPDSEHSKLQFQFDIVKSRGKVPSIFAS
jgi:hypothetical protein